ncbi:peptidoglycan D,D-transpeptidase FtsI family protein [Nocardioides bruguierae]|uniref:peptidoglycan D,D-transpeptidase FtsI family protein n=1 Tax=Nocardioides bruguierae TaxID=2945102 RepID=UPI0020218864|nr:penicillin-binding protein 2 [Nocardioides bruguierae]MCL8026740.1 penicillin-binding protein 2 [Nocardioides bruguierae]
MNKPIRTISVFALVLFLALLLNVTYLQYWRADSLDSRADNRRAVDAEFSQPRGAILVGNDPIATSEPSDDRYEYQRTYSDSPLYAPLTGWYNYFNAQSGTCSSCQQFVEQTQDDVLSGSDDRLFVTRLVDLLSNQESVGGNVKLTINARAQQAAYDGLLDVVGDDGEGAVVAIEPRTGKILAMVSLPSFNANALADHDLTKVQRTADRLQQGGDSSPLVNRAVQTTLPPGSTFKLVTAAAAIEDGLYTEDDDVPGGATYQLPQTTGDTGLIDNEGRDCGTDLIPFTQALENSCNTTFARMAVELGVDKLSAQAEAFGFNQQYFTDLSPQATSVFPDDADEPQTGQSGIGQFEVRATPLQMAMVAAGIANGGEVMKPYLVDEVQSPDFESIETTDPETLSQAVSSDTADQLTDMMVSTVDNGTASPAAITGISVAGKTGTAQSGTDSSPYAWFVSFAPAENPTVAVAVMIQDAPGLSRGEIAGGLLGGPIAKAVMEAVIK